MIKEVKSIKRRGAQQIKNLSDQQNKRKKEEEAIKVNYQNMGPSQISRQDSEWEKKYEMKDEKEHCEIRRV